MFQLAGVYYCGLENQTVAFVGLGFRVLFQENRGREGIA